MVAEFTAMYTSIKTATEFVKGFNQLKTEAAIADAKIELQNIIFSLHSQASSLQEKYDEIVHSKSEMEKQLSDLRNFNSEKQKYIPKEIAPGIIAYVPKEEKDRISKTHWLCQNCLDNQKKFSIYQFDRGNEYGSSFYCPNPTCKNKIYIANPDPPDLPKIEYRPNW